MRGQAHDTLGLAAVREAERVSQLVQSLLDGAFAKQFVVGRQPVKLLAQPAQGNHGHGPFELCLAEQEAEHGNRQIRFGDSNDASGVGRRRLCQCLHDVH